MVRCSRCVTTAWDEWCGIRCSAAGCLYQSMSEEELLEYGFGFLFWLMFFCFWLGWTLVTKGRAEAMKAIWGYLQRFCNSIISGIFLIDMMTLKNTFNKSTVRMFGVPTVGSCYEAGSSTKGPVLFSSSVSANKCFGSTPHPVTVDKQSFQFYQGANTNLHDFHCYRVGGLPKSWIDDWWKLTDVCCVSWWENVDSNLVKSCSFCTDAYKVAGEVYKYILYS